MNRLRQVHWLARGSLAFMFAYHGLENFTWLPQAAGVAELAMAALLLLAPRMSWPLILAGVVLLGLLVDVAVMQPSMLMDAFNPVTVNVAGMALCAIAWVTRVGREV